jgi:hypothetical protein
MFAPYPAALQKTQQRVHLCNYISIAFFFNNIENKTVMIAHTKLEASKIKKKH